MRHTHYYEVIADSNYELGLKLGKLFGADLKNVLKQEKESPDWEWKVKESNKYITYTKESFPQLLEELEGYSVGAGVDFTDLWVLSLEDELYREDKCTTLITNKGMLVGHNEDYKDAQEKVCILKKTIRNTIILELYYIHTLGGNSISINSNGYIHAIDSLSQTDVKVGIPKNVVARWISETSSPYDDFHRFQKLERASGFCHNLISTKDGEVSCIESTATKERIDNVTLPFVHANHYLTDLNIYEDNNNSTHTLERCQSGKDLIKKEMTVEEMKNTLEDVSNGPKVSLFNERTVASMVVDSKGESVYIWLLREKDKGWIKYDLNYIVE
jgi:hypothetical protein